MTAYYVAKTGSNSNSGLSAAAAKLTIMSIAPSLGPNDILYILNGSYNEEVTFTNQSGSSWSSPITVSAYPGHAPIIAPVAQQGLKLQNGTSYVQFLNLIFDGYYTTSTTLISNNVGDPHHNRIQDCEVKNCGRSLGSMGSSGNPTNTNGILTDGHHHEYIRLRVHHNGNGGYDHGFYGLGDNTLMEFCDVYENSGHGCQKYGDGNDCIIRNNIFRSNGQSGYLGGPLAGGSGLGIYGGMRNYVYNNICYKNWESGIVAHYGEHDSFIDNNTIWANVDGEGLTVGGITIEEAQVMTVRNNLVIENNGSQQIYFKSPSLAITATNIVTGSSTFHFVNAAAGDFRLNAGSSAINAGTDLSSIFTTDFYGNTRS